MLYVFNAIYGLGQDQFGFCNSIYDTTCYPFAQKGVPCHDWEWDCKLRKASLILYTVTAAFTFLILVIFLIFIFLAKRELNGLPYNQYRIAHIQMGFQVPIRVITILFYAVSELVRWIGADLCSTLISMHLSNGAVEACILGMVCITSYINCPHLIDEKYLKLHSLVQEFAWAEEELKTSEECLEKEDPIFCFETALKCHFFSMLTYFVDELPSDDYTLETAMELYCA